MAQYASPHGSLYIFPGGSNVVIYVHGYYTGVDQAMTDYALAQQFAASGVPATFVVPEAQSASGDAVPWPSLGELLSYVQAQTGISASSVHVIGHSGAYGTILKWLSEPALTRVSLLDALYAGVQSFKDWAAQFGHKLEVVGVTAQPVSNGKALIGAPNVTVSQVGGDHYSIVKPGGLLPEVIAAGQPSSLALMAAVGVVAGLLGVLWWRLSS